MALLGLLLYLQTISTLDISRFLGIAILLQIAELDTLYTRLEGNKCNVPSLIHAITLLSAIPQSWDNLVTSILTSQTLLTQLT